MHTLTRSLKFIAAVLAFCATTTAARAQCVWAVVPTTMDFGTYDVFGGGSNATTSTGSVKCTGAYDVTVASTTGASGTYAARKMSGTATYQVYIDPGETMIWGNATGGTQEYAFSNTGGPNTYSGFAYGQVPGAQDLAPGTYNDSLTVTLSFRLSSGGAWTNLAGVALAVKMVVVAECRADIFSIPFGNYNPVTGAVVNQSTTVKAYCTKSTPATFSLDNGSNALGVQKRMVNGGVNFLNYTATLATASGTSVSSLTPIGGGVALNASIPASQDVPASATAYIDTLQVLINY